MKKQKLIPLTFIATIFIVACSNELSINEDNNLQTETNQKVQGYTGLTGFAGSIDATTIASTGTRTAAIYQGQLKFFYTEGDRLWVNNPATIPALRMDSANNVSELLRRNHTNKVASASFFFSGQYRQDRKYNVRYTGKGNHYGDLVNIKTLQTQKMPNDVLELGVNGDCAVGDATYNNGRFEFTLKRSAAYLTFVPYNSAGIIAGMRFVQVTIRNPYIAMSGQFRFNDNGIDLDSRPSPTECNRSVTLKVDRFGVPQQKNPDNNASIMVLAPGNYHNLVITYTLYDPTTHVTVEISKELSELKITAGQNYLVAQDMGIRIYGDKYYMWDAKDEYWAGYKRSQPKLNFGQNDNYPKRYHKDPNRWFNQAYYNGGVAINASASAKNCPNVNLTHWFVEAGGQYWDNTTGWATMGHLYKGGMWIKTEAAIQAQRRNRYLRNLSSEAYNGHDFTTETVNGNHTSRVTRKGKPADTDNYFFLPALGCYDNHGKLFKLGEEGYYWTKSPIHGGYHQAYALKISPNKISLYFTDRNNGLCVWQTNRL